MYWSYVLIHLDKKRSSLETLTSPVVEFQFVQSSATKQVARVTFASNNTAVRIRNVMKRRYQTFCLQQLTDSQQQKNNLYQRSPQRHPGSSQCMTKKDRNPWSPSRDKVNCNSGKFTHLLIYFIYNFFCLSVSCNNCNSIHRFDFDRLSCRKLWLRDC